LRRQIFTRTLDGVAFFIQQTIDEFDHFHIIWSVMPTGSSAFERLEHGKLIFPVTQDMRLDIEFFR
jgi:hypothetical protein